uniref:Ninein (GSK3B interacting protein) n=1 Tax=Xiphophorus couchianus TaxID=32473 RepID=A0A3B5L2M4_9TELE
MDDGQGQDDSEERLKEVFNSFDSSGCGSLSPEELSDLCQSLHLDDAAPALIHSLLQNQDLFTVDFDQFKHALILVLSSTIEPPQSPEIQPKFVKRSKRYGRRSTPEFQEPVSDFSEVTNINPANEDDLEDNYDSAVPRKREEYEAEGQMHLWNPDEPSTPRGSVVPLSARLEERLREACEELAMAWDGSKLKMMNVREFVSRVVNNNKPLSPSASTPYRQLKRHHSTQPFDEGGRRISALTSTIGMRLFSTLDDGSGFTPAEYVLDAWIEEGIENSAEILQALNFNLEGKLSLGELTVALENELLSTKNHVHQAALASFKAEIRYLLEQVDREIGEKKKIQSDLEKTEKQKTQLATEVDEHHSAIEHMNNLNLRSLEQDYKEKLTAIRSELTKEMDQMQQQAGLQREELEAEIQKIREEESLLRDHLSISVKENRRLETELLDSTEKLTEAQSQITKLQANLENIMKDKFGDLDPGSADFFLQEERIKQLRCGYEAQCRVTLQDRIDELQSELQGFHSLGRAHESGGKPLSEELDSKSPGTESDPGIGPDEVQPFSMSLEAEMMLEQLKEQHLQETEHLQNQLQSKVWHPLCRLLFMPFSAGVKTESFRVWKIMKEVEISFTQRIREAEDRFSCDQESAAERFQAQLLKLEQHYQSELTTLSESHAAQKLRWEAEMQKVLEGAEERRKAAEETAAEERQRLDREQENERRELENVHGEETEALRTENERLRNELEDALSGAQRKEIELSMQLNDLHGRLQEKRQLLAQSEDRVLQAELLLNQTVEDFKQERAELLGSNSELQAKHDEALSGAERLVEERMHLVTERDALQVKVEELETLLKQAALDFELERKEILENLVVLEEKLRDAREVEALRAERDVLKSKLEELQVVSSTNKEESKGINVLIINQDYESCQAQSDQDEDGLERCINADQELDDGDFATIEDQTHEQDGQDGAKENQENCCAFSDDKVVDSPDQKHNYLYVKNKCQPVSHESQGEDVSRLQAFADKNKAAAESPNQETEPQEDGESCLHGDQQHHETEVVGLMLWEAAGDPAEVDCLSDGSHSQQEGGENQEISARDGVETVEVFGCENQESPALNLQDLYDTAREENVLLHEKIALLQQKSEILESLLARHSEKLKSSHRALEENYKLKVQALLLMEHVKELQVKSLRMADLQIRYEDCACENAKLKDQNDALEKRVWSLESRLDVFREFGDRRASLVDEIGRMRAENGELFHLLSELERQEDGLSDSDAKPAEGRSDEPPLQPEKKSRAGFGVEECCREFEERNSELRRTIAELQDESQIISETTRPFSHPFSLQLISADESFKVVNRQSARLKSDLRVLQQERDSLKHEVAVLHKQLQNANEKNQILEMALHSSGLQSQSRKLNREDISWVMEKEQQLLRQENEKLKAEVHNIGSDLLQSREKVSSHQQITRGAPPEQRAAHADSCRRIGGL